MSQTAVQEPTKARPPLNGVNTPNLFATINAVGGFLVTDRMLQMFRKRGGDAA